MALVPEKKRTKTSNNQDWLEFLNVKDYRDFTKTFENDIRSQRISFNPTYLHLRDENQLLEILSEVVASSENAKKAATPALNSPINNPIGFAFDARLKAF